MEIRQCGDMQEPMQLLELPGISLDYFLRGLAGEAYQDNAVFQELYSWYLQSPEYRILVKKLTEASFSERPSDKIGKTDGKDPLWRNFPVQCYPAGAFCGLCICTFSADMELKITERAEYEFRAMVWEMSCIWHWKNLQAEVRKEGLDWAELTEEERNRIIDSCLDQVSRRITEIRSLKAVREMNI